MALGAQFDKTYWEDPEQPGSYFSSRERTYDEMMSRNPSMGVRIAKTKSIDKVPSGYQGMLFSPFEGTGLVHDPSVSKEERRGAVNKALSLYQNPNPYGGRKPFFKSSEEHLKDIREDVSRVKQGGKSKFTSPNADYIKRKKAALSPTGLDDPVRGLLKRVAGSRLFVNNYSAAREQSILSDTLFHSGMPTSEIKRLGTPGFNPYKETSEGNDTLIFNKFQRRLLKSGKASADASQPTGMRASPRIRIFPESGIQGVKKRMDTPDYENPAYITNNSRIPSILIHEMGHSQDMGNMGASWMHLKNPKGKKYPADPRIEGIADGYSQRNQSFHMYTQNQIKNMEIPGRGIPLERVGYGSTNKNWDTPEKQALYEMSRWATVTAKQGDQSIPSRSDLIDANPNLYKDYELSVENMRAVDDHVMHTIMERNPGVLDRLDKVQGFSMSAGKQSETLGDTARKASQRHLERLYGPKPVQQTLF
jgi:hypothetical protein